MTRAFLLLPLLLLLSCGHGKGSGTGASGNEYTEETDQAVGNNFYKRYSGTIAGKPVVVHLTSYAGTVQGVYYYESIGQGIALRDWYDSAKGDNDFHFTEMSDDPEASSGDGPTWSLRIDGHSATGEWHSADGLKNFPINLTESYPEGSVQLNAYRLSDSAALRPNDTHSPVATISYGYLLPPGEQGSFLYNIMKEQVSRVPTHSGNIDDVIREEMATWIAEYRRDNEQTSTDSDAVQDFTLSYTSDDAIYVRYNEANWLVVESFSSTYSGGAHGNYASSFANIDLAQKRVWTLTDIVADTAALRPMLNDAAIARFSLKPGEAMDQRLQVEDVWPTDNVFIGPKGLSFLYNPYEIASFADGQITLYLPYAKLFNLLTPAFRQRMGLSASAGVAMLSVLR